MKKELILAFATVAMFASCKSNKNLTNANTVAEDTATVSEEVDYIEVAEQETPATSSWQEEANNTSTPSVDINEAPVRSQSETFTFADNTEALTYKGNNYFIIVGSFSSIQNANRQKDQLTKKGFVPVVLQSESGYFRVSVASHKEEHEARKQVSSIRTSYPELADCWLLIKK